MSGRITKWVVLVILPLLLALYASYPPAGVVVKRERVVRKEATSADEAARHGVESGEAYVVERETLERNWLPLALGERDVETRIVERRRDGSSVEERTVTVRGRIKLGLDLAGGTELLYQLSPEEGERITGGVSNTIDILKKRIDPGNVKEYRIQALERDRILIQVPQATTAEVEQLKRRLEKMGKLEFKIAIPRGSDKTKFQQWYAEAREGQVPEGYAKMFVEGDQSRDFYLVERGEPQITGRYLARVYPQFDQFGNPVVGFEFDAMGSRKFARITENNIGMSLAIILDGVLKSAPIVEERISASGIIRGQFTQQEVNDMVNVLQAGSLPMDIQLLQESTVGPQLGRDSIRRGLWALAVAGLLVVAFIGIYYLACGLVADGALLMNLVLLVGILCVLGAALTLPGMAGILLTIGMAVDANVLIFERIREESEAGKGPRVALRNGYDRAFTTIVDANVTTLLTAIILYLVGTGPIRGFAVTLSFGILLSMFTALVVTRLAFETMLERGWIERFRMFSLVGKPSIDFSRIRRPAYIISAVVVAAGLVAFGLRGSSLYDIDFTGGSLVYVSLDKPTPVAEVRARLAESGFEDAEVQAFRTPGSAEGGGTDFGIRFKGAGVEKVRRTAKPDVERRLREAGLLQPGDRVEVSADGRAVELNLREGTTEADLRQALADGDPYELDEIGTIVPTDTEALFKKVTVHLHGIPPLAERQEVLSRAITALSWAGLRTEAYTIEGWQPLQEGEGLQLVLDKPVARNLLSAEMVRRGFPDLVVAEGGEDTRFVLRGDPELLARLQREFPAGAELRGVPTARIEGYTVTAELAREFSEPDVRVLFEKQDLPDVYVVPLDLAARSWRLNLSSEPIRGELRAAFADLAQRSGGATFTEVSRGEGERVVEMQLAEPMAFADVRHYIRASGLGRYAEGIIVDEEDYGLETRVSELRLALPEDKADGIMARIADSFGEPRVVQKIVSIGAVVAEELQGRALLAVIFASVIIVLYVAARFHALRFGVAAVIALVHDVLITAGLIALADWSGVLGDVKINLAMLAAFLTILGYSLNDTIVVFDRIRENMGILGRDRVSPDLVNMSINQTLSRTVLTSMTTLMVVVVLYALGGPVLRGLALTLIFGVLVGTYSSMFIASPVLLDWSHLTAGVSASFRGIFFVVRLPFRLIGMAFGGGR